jgi:hypothetical protein
VTLGRNVDHTQVGLQIYENGHLLGVAVMNKAQLGAFIRMATAHYDHMVEEPANATEISKLDLPPKGD